MVRFIILTILNLSLPFLLRGLYLAFLHYQAKRKGGSAPEWHFPWVKLLTIGLVLAMLSIAVSRFFVDESQFEGHRSTPLQHYTTEK